MGADLIVSILVGPVKLKPNKAQRKAIIEKAQAKISAAELLVGHRVEQDFKAERLPQIRAAAKQLSKSGAETEEISDLARMRSEETLDAFLNLWANGARDANYRPVTISGKKYQILVAGEMSWGDSPMGDGYLTVQKADKLGILDALGIR